MKYLQNDTILTITASVGALIVIAGITLHATSLSAATPSVDDRVIKNPAATIICKQSACDVYLTDHEVSVGAFKQRVNIGTPEEYVDVVNLYNVASPSTKIRLHLAGDGGIMTGLMVLYDAIQKSKAQTTSIIMDDVASADAVLGIASKHLEISKYAVFMFHRSSIYGTDPGPLCASEIGQTDRTQDAHQKCLDAYNTLIQKDEKFFVDLLKSLLPENKFNDVMSGHDVNIPATEVKESFDRKHK